MEVSNEVMNIYGNDGDQFDKAAIDTAGNIICIGHVKSEGSDTKYPLVVKYDTNLNVLFKKMYYDINLDEFRGVTTDSSGNIICIGWTVSEETDSDVAVVVKFDTNLNIIAKRIYGDSGGDWFNGVATDSSGNVICVGHTTPGSTSGAGSYDALVVKFDTNLNIIAKRIYSDSGDSGDEFDQVTTDSNDNVICVGWTDSEGAGSSEYPNRVDALIVKYDSDLDIHWTYSFRSI